MIHKGGGVGFTPRGWQAKQEIGRVSIFKFFLFYIRKIYTICTHYTFA